MCQVTESGLHTGLWKGERCGSFLLPPGSNGRSWEPIQNNVRICPLQIGRESTGYWSDVWNWVTAGMGSCIWGPEFSDPTLRGNGNFFFLCESVRKSLCWFFLRHTIPKYCNGKLERVFRDHKWWVMQDNFFTISTVVAIYRIAL